MAVKIANFLNNYFGIITTLSLGFAIGVLIGLIYWLVVLHGMFP